VAFPVMTLVLHLSPTIARDFSFMVQCCGKCLLGHGAVMSKMSFCSYKILMYTQCSGSCQQETTTIMYVCKCTQVKHCVYTVLCTMCNAWILFITVQFNLRYFFLLPGGMANVVAFAPSSTTKSRRFYSHRSSYLHLGPI
jgi:hypothetical protein